MASSECPSTTGTALVFMLKKPDILAPASHLTEAKDFLDKDPELRLFSFFSVILISAGTSKYYYNSTSQKGKKKKDQNFQNKNSVEKSVHFHYKVYHNVILSLIILVFNNIQLSQ